MLTREDQEEIKRLVAETIAESSASSLIERMRVDDVDTFQRLVTQIQDLIFQGFTEVSLMNPTTHEIGASRVLQKSNPIVDVTARAMEVFGTREKALRWHRTPVRSLGDRAPISLLDSPEGVARVQGTLGQVEHGVW